MQTATEHLMHQGECEADRLREAIRRHRRKIRPSTRSEADDELYQALAPAGEVPGFSVVPPAAYTNAAERYYDSPY